MDDAVVVKYLILGLGAFWIWSWLSGLGRPRVWVRPELAELVWVLGPPMKALMSHSADIAAPQAPKRAFRVRTPSPEVRMQFAKELTRYAAKKFGMRMPRVGLRFAPLSGHAGSVRQSSQTWYVEIDSRYRDDNHQLTAIIAHEVAHVFLASCRIRLEPTQRNEELTDAAAVFAGFGEAMQKAYHRVTTQWYIVATVTEVSRLGYLAVQDIAVLQRIRNRISTGSALRIRTRICTETEPTYQCIACTAPVSLPRVDARIRLTCRHCGFPVQLSLTRSPPRPTFPNAIRSLFDRASDRVRAL